MFAALDGIREIAAREGIPVSQLALRWCIAAPEMTCVLAGVRNPSQLEHDARAFSRALSSEVVKKLNELTDPVTDKIGTNPDYFEGRSNSRMR
jgi:aryl-alcohol dehydrogenase-like predicted oxidoreductase